jgi:hypothetical protein
MPISRMAVLRRGTAIGVTAAVVITPLLPMTGAHASGLCSPLPDTVPPQVSQVTFNRQKVDLDSGSRRVTVTADATDTSGNGAGSGITQLDVFVSGPHAGADPKMSLVSGTPTDGVWRGSFTVPKDGPAGTWSLSSVDAADADNNRQDYEHYGTHVQSPTDIALQAGWDTSFTVTGTGPPPPKKHHAGTVTAFSFTPHEVDTTHTRKTVHISVNFSKPQPKRALINFVHNTNSGRHYFARGAALKHAHGTKWSAHFTLHRWMGDNTLEAAIYAVYPTTVTPRDRSFSSSALRKRHFATLLTVHSRTDKTKPKLRTLSFSPPTVETTTGAQTVTVTATASDTHSGVGGIDADLYINHGGGGSASGLYPYPGLGYQDSGAVNVTLKPVGDKWIGTLRFRRCVPSGSWNTEILLNDRAGNSAGYNSKKLAAEGLPGHLSVTSTPGDVQDPGVRDATASGVDHTITLDFTEGVKNVTTSTLSVYALKPVSTRFEYTTAVTAITCSDGTAEVDCSGSGGLVTSAVLTVTGLTGGGKYQVYANQNATTSQLTDGNGNPLPWNYEAADVTGS